MSDDTTKLKRSKRFLKDETKAKRQYKIAKEYGLVDRNKTPHYYAKKHAMNCGNPTCIMCSNPRKLWGEKTFQEMKFDGITEAGLADVNNR
jgi:hypothetical protein